MAKKSQSFDGETFEPEHDLARLQRQLDEVRALMIDGAWRTLEEIAQTLGHPEASISARLRDLRKGRFGGWRVERRSRGERARGLFEYRLGVREEPEEKTEKGKTWRRPARTVLDRAVFELRGHLTFCKQKKRVVTSDVDKLMDWLLSEIGV